MSKRKSSSSACKSTSFEKKKRKPKKRRKGKLERDTANDASWSVHRLDEHPDTPGIFPDDLFFITCPGCENVIGSKAAEPTKTVKYACDALQCLHCNSAFCFYCLKEIPIAEYEAADGKHGPHFARWPKQKTTNGSTPYGWCVNRIKQL